MTDQDVADLYRCLLNRAPETPDTVAAFKAYYPDFARGRRAVLQSAEFAELFAEAHGAAATRLSRALLRRAGGLATVAPPENAALRGAMQLILRAHGAVHLAVVVAGADAPLQDLFPIPAGHAAILHIAPSFPAFLPQTAELPGGATVFRINLDAPGVASLLAAADLRIALLAVLDGDPAWFDTMQPWLAGQSILVSNTELPAVTDTWPDAERVLLAGGLSLRFLGGWFLPVTYAPSCETTRETIPETTEHTTETPIPGLCIAAIVRNEQAAIVNMLASIAPAAASFVVLDTGSTDDTVALADAYLRASGKPYVLETIAPDQPPPRFDTMRNAALDLAPLGTEWVLMLDADEELCAEDRTALRALLQVADQDAYALPRYNYIGIDKAGEVTPYPDRQVRLLRHNTQNPPRYSGAVHETIRGAAVGRLPLDATALDQDQGGPHIHHLVRRFRTPEAEAAKQAFYQQIAAENMVEPQ